MSSLVNPCNQGHRVLDIPYISLADHHPLVFAVAQNLTASNRMYPSNPKSAMFTYTLAHVTPSCDAAIL